MEPYTRLAAGIIKQAVRDMRATNCKIEKCEKRIKLLEPQIGHIAEIKLEGELDKLKLLKGQRRKLEQFFAGEWFEGLCGMVGLDSDGAKETMKTGK